MTTNIVQIGNTDNKLTQRQWSEFCNEIQYAIEMNATEVHFTGFSNPNTPWQNACFVFNLEKTDNLKASIFEIRNRYKQDAVAWTEGTTQFI